VVTPLATIFLTPEAKGRVAALLDVGTALADISTPRRAPGEPLLPEVDRGGGCVR